MPPSQEPSSCPSVEQHNLRPSQGRLLWMCVAVGSIAAAVVLWLFGFTLWVIAMFLLLAACPLVVVWVLTMQPRGGQTHGKWP